MTLLERQIAETLAACWPESEPEPDPVPLSEARRAAVLTAIDAEAEAEAEVQAARLARRERAAAAVTERAYGPAHGWERGGWCALGALLCLLSCVVVLSALVAVLRFVAR